MSITDALVKAVLKVILRLVGAAKSQNTQVCLLSEGTVQLMMHLERVLQFRIGRIRISILADTRDINHTGQML